MPGGLHALRMQEPTEGCELIEGGEAADANMVFKLVPPEGSVRSLPQPCLPQLPCLRCSSILDRQRIIVYRRGGGNQLGLLAE